MSRQITVYLRSLWQQPGRAVQRCGARLVVDALDGNVQQRAGVVHGDGLARGRVRYRVSFCRAADEAMLISSINPTAQ